MAWQEITESDLQKKLNGPELEQLKAAVLATGQSDPIPDTILQVVKEVRGYVAAGGFTLGTGNTIPDELLDAACRIIRWRAATRLNVKMLLGEDRKMDYQDAISLLNRVADGKFLVEAPATATTQVIGGMGPSMTAKTRTMTRADQDGI